MKFNELPTELQAILCKLHTHAELCDSEEIVYKEHDFINMTLLLKKYIHHIIEHEGIDYLSKNALSESSPIFTDEETKLLKILADEK